MSIRHEAVRLLEGDEPRTESNIDRIVRGLLVENYTLACEKYAAEYAARLRGDTMTDDLLDEAERLHYEVIRDDRDAEWRRLNAEHDLVPALAERVRAAEAERQEWADLWQKASMSVLRLTDERDAARGKLDTVRALVTTPPVFGDLAPARWYGYADMRRDVLAILDGNPA